MDTRTNAIRPYHYPKRSNNPNLQDQSLNFMRNAFKQPFIKIITAAVAFVLWAQAGFGQLYSSADFDKKYAMVIQNPGVQIEATEAINKMYNFKFAEADKDFRWLLYRYPRHPMPYFLMGSASTILESMSARQRSS